jgi:predicted O-methyltransferase YrrM
MWLMNLIETLFERFAYLYKGNVQGVSIGYLSKSGSEILPSYDDLISKFPLITLADLESGLNFYEKTVKSKSGTIFPDNFDSGPRLNSFLYAYIRAYKPRTIVETGVANGITTNVILEALDNGTSVLHSFDVDSRTQLAYAGMKNWNFHLLKPPFHRGLISQISKFSGVDLWLHDSNHGSAWQGFEYSLALEKLNPGCVLVSDDVDASTAWANRMRGLTGNSYVIHDFRKVVGIHQKK